MKKFLSLIIVALMLVSILPLAAFAADEVTVVYSSDTIAIDKFVLATLTNNTNADISLHADWRDGSAGADADVRFYTKDGVISAENVPFVLPANGTVSILIENWDYGNDVRVRFNNPGSTIIAGEKTLDYVPYEVIVEEEVSDVEATVASAPVVSATKISDAGSNSDKIDELDGVEFELTLNRNSKAKFDSDWIEILNSRGDLVTYYYSLDDGDTWKPAQYNWFPVFFGAGEETVNVVVKAVSSWAGSFETVFATDSSITWSTWEDYKGAVVDGKAVKAEFENVAADDVVLSVLADGTELANGIDTIEVTATVTDKAGHAAKGQTVTFSIVGGFGKLSETTATTNASGKATVKVTSTKPDTKITVKATCNGESDTYGDATTENLITFKNVGVTALVADEDSDNQLIKKGDTIEFELEAKDLFGNKVSLNGTTVNKKVTTEPSGSKLSLTGGPATWTATPAKEGKYEVKFYLDNGSSVTYKFEVKDFDDEDFKTLTLDYGNDAYAAEGRAIPTVKAVTEDGYKYTYTYPADYTNLTFSCSDASLANVSEKGLINFKSDTGVITVTVFDSNLKLTATQTLNIVKAATALKVSAPASTPAGDDAKVSVQLVNVDGVAVANGYKPANDDEFVVTIVSEPEGGLASVTGKDYADFDTEGAAEFKVTNYMPGTVKLNVIAKTTAGIYSGTVEVVFGDAALPVGAGDAVFMIGANSFVAGGVSYAATSTPYVDANGRTMLGIRDLGTALGATVKYEAGVATLVKGDVTVTVKAGEKFITVNGTQKAIDTEAVVKEGRIYLPFRAVVEAFGYTVSYANGVITVK